MTAACGRTVFVGLVALAATTVATAGDAGPEWFRRPERPLADLRLQSPDELLVVLQRKRPDGADFLTFRYPVAQFGSLLAFAGAGLNRAVYYSWTDPGEAGLTTRDRRRSVGAAAELGAEWRVNESLALAADLHWMDLASDAEMLRSANGLVAADSVGVGISLGWRFR